MRLWPTWCGHSRPASLARDQHIGVDKPVNVTTLQVCASGSDAIPGYCCCCLGQCLDGYCVIHGLLQSPVDNSLKICNDTDLVFSTAPLSVSHRRLCTPLAELDILRKWRIAGIVTNHAIDTIRLCVDSMCPSATEFLAARPTSNV